MKKTLSPTYSFTHKLLRATLAVAQVFSALSATVIGIAQPTLPDAIASLQPLIGLPNAALAASPIAPLAQQAASCLAVDEWTTAQTIGGTGLPTSSVVSGAGILGGERDMFFTNLIPANANGIVAMVEPKIFLGFPALNIANNSVIFQINGCMGWRRWKCHHSGCQWAWGR